MFLEIEGLLFFYRGTYTIVEEKNAWVYNKIRNFINQSSLEKDLKDLANAVIDLAERKISIDDVATKLSKFPKS